MVMLLAALLVASDPAVAAPQSPPDSATTQAKPSKEKMVCKVYNSESYSRLRKRECHTQTEWDNLQSGASANDLKNIGGR
jgi:hypothetical protein